MHPKFYVRSSTRSWDIRGYPKSLGVTWPGHALFRKNSQGLLLRLTRWIVLPNFTFLALPVPTILVGTLKILGVTWQIHASFSGKIIKGICLDCPCEYATEFYIRSFTLSWDIRGYPKKLGVTWHGHARFWKQIIRGICLVYPSE